MVYNKPLPNKKGISEKYWEGLNNNKFLIQNCNHCKEMIFYPRVLCPFCGQQDIEFKNHNGRGIIYSFTIVHKTHLQGYSNETPYVVALIKLDGGNAKLMSNIIECDFEKIQIGMKVKVVFTKITNEFTLPQFKPLIEGGY